MKCLGLVAGPDPETGSIYWRLLHAEARRRVGHEESVCFVVESLGGPWSCELRSGADHRRAARVVADAARRLEDRGAECVLLCSSLLHLVAEEVAVQMHVPLLRMTEATGEKLVQLRLQSVGLLGARPREERMWQEALVTARIRRPLLPRPDDRGLVTRCLDLEIPAGPVSAETRSALVRMVAEFKHAGARHGSFHELFGANQAVSEEIFL